MTKKEKILFSFISNIINDEKPDSIKILTSQDISKLIKRIEKTARQPMRGEQEEKRFGYE